MFFCCVVNVSFLFVLWLCCFVFSVQRFLNLHTTSSPTPHLSAVSNRIEKPGIHRNSGILVCFQAGILMFSWSARLHRFMFAGSLNHKPGRFFQRILSGYRVHNFCVSLTTNQRNPWTPAENHPEQVFLRIPGCSIRLETALSSKFNPGFNAKSTRMCSRRALWRALFCQVLCSHIIAW